jgi:hypothetical protein
VPLLGGGGVATTGGGAGGAATTGTLSVFWVTTQSADTQPKPSGEYWVEIFTCHQAPSELFPLTSPDAPVGATNNTA